MARRPRASAWVGGAAVLAVAVVSAAVAARLHDGAAALPETGDVAVDAEAAALPAPGKPAFRLGYVAPLRAFRAASRWAPVLGVAPVRSRPSPDADVVGALERQTSLGTENIVLVLRHARVGGRLWVEVRFPSTGRATGWVPRDRIGGYHFVDTHLVVDRGRLTATLLRDGRPVFQAAVGIGTAEFPTPGGSFYVREKLTNFEDPVYGPVAFGTSARSAVLTDWPDGGSIGIHGTNRPELLPGRVSHGCIRMRNEDILRLARLMPVGTPLTIA